MVAVVVLILIVIIVVVIAIVTVVRRHHTGMSMVAASGMVNFDKQACPLNANV